MTATLLKGSFMNFFRNPWAIIILVLLVVLLFVAGKLRGVARNVVEYIRIFMSEVEELPGEDAADDVEGDERGRRDQRSSRSREDDVRDDRRRHDQERRYDPRDDEGEAEPVRAQEDDDSYRRD